MRERESPGYKFKHTLHQIFLICIYGSAELHTLLHSSTSDHSARVPVVGEQSVGEYEPSPLISFDIVSPFEQPAAKLLRACAAVHLAHSSARSS